MYDSFFDNNRYLIFVKGALETMDYFTDQMVFACDSLRVNYYVINLGDEDSYTGEEFYGFIHKYDCVAFLFNNIGLGILCNGESLWDSFEIPVYDFIVDHPRFFSDWFEDPIKKLRVIVLDRNHERFIRRFFHKIKKVYFMPDGGTDVNGSIPYENRTIDVLYTGNCQKKIDSFPVVTFWEDRGAEFYRVCIDAMIQYPQLITEDVVDWYISNNISSPLNNENIRDLHILYAPYIEEFVRRHFKQLAMRALDEAGIEVEVYGDNWNDNDYEYGKNIHFHDRVSSEACNKLACQAKICLNFMPWFKDGCSERVFNAMLNGSVCLSDRSGYLEGNYKDGKDIVFFDLNNPSQMVMDVKWLLQNPKAAEQIAFLGYEHAYHEDTWVCRMKKFLSICSGENN